MASMKVKPIDIVNGPTNSQSLLRLFSKKKESVRVILYRDNHAWCPYCQKVWLYLEEKQIPYEIKKVTMFCYGKKEAWYKDIVPSGMLPALQIDNGKIITESDDILTSLENVFGKLGEFSITDPDIMNMRKLERYLFRAWCQWLCYPSRSKHEEESNRLKFIKVAKHVETVMQKSKSPYALSSFSIADVIFTPYVERMNASLYYYKGYSFRDVKNHPVWAAWFEAMETRETYRGTQSDFHTHVHDLPPQMGGCYENEEPLQLKNKNLINSGPFDSIPEVMYEEPTDSREEAALRVIKHKDTLISINPHAGSIYDAALRCTLSNMLTGRITAIPPMGSAAPLLYLRDRISVPRDMPIYSARRLRETIKLTVDAISPSSSTATDMHPVTIPANHRRDQNPVPFKK